MGDSAGNSSQLAPPPWLKPWRKGQSGNPSGMSRVKREVRDLAKANSVRAMQKIVDLMDAEDERVALAAAIEVKNTAIGKPRTRDLTREEIEREVDKRIADLTAKALEAKRGAAIDVESKER